MIELQPQSGAIPTPVPGPISQPWWDGCAAGVLRYQRCDDCGAPTHTPALLCANCASRALTWVDASGRGEIYSWTRVWRPVTPAFTTPYVPIIVAMEEGWSMLSALIGCDDEAVEIGMAVEVEFHALDGGLALPYFRPAVPR